MAFNLINIDDQQIFKDKKKIKIIRNLKETVVLLGPDKGNGVVVLDKIDYVQSMEQLFEDRTKFKIINDDPTYTRMTTLQNYVRMLKNTGQIDEEEYKILYPKNAKVGRAHGSAKVHKEFERIPPLRPIVDTIGSTHYGAGKFITKLLTPLTQNAYSLKDSFDAAEKIKAIPQNLYDEGYTLVSFDVKSLFTNVPLRKTVNVILDRVYNQKLITTKLKKRTLKKLIIDTCSKTAFSCNNILYEQIDGVSMGACLGPVLANIIMTELEKVVVDRMIDSGLIKFYARYVDDTLLLVKPADVDEILQKFNRFHRNLEFTVDKFENCVPHFLDLEIHPDGISIYRKDTHTAQFVNYNSYTKLNHKTAWIKSLISRAKRLCSPARLKNEMENIKRFASYNGFPRWVVNSTIQTCNQTRADESQEEEIPSISLSLPYIGKRSEQIVRRTKKKLAKTFKEQVKINVFFKSTKLFFFTSNKDKTPQLGNSFIVYEYTCPGCSEKYIGKTESTLFNRTKQHAWTQKDSAVCKHFDKCEGWAHIKGLLELDGELVEPMQLQTNIVRQNTKIIGRADDWRVLAFKESLKIKDKRPSLNHGVKATKDLCLF